MKARMNTTVKDLLDGLQEALQNDDELAYGYHANIACMVMDTLIEEWGSNQERAYELANQAAIRIMKLLFNTDTSADMLADKCCKGECDECQCDQCEPEPIDIEATRQAMINKALADHITAQDKLKEEFEAELTAIRRGDRDPKPISETEKRMAEGLKVIYGPGLADVLKAQQEFYEFMSRIFSRPGEAIITGITED